MLQERYLLETNQELVQKQNAKKELLMAREETQSRYTLPYCSLSEFVSGFDFDRSLFTSLSTLRVIC